MISVWVTVMGSLVSWSKPQSPSPDPSKGWMCNLISWTGSTRTVVTDERRREYIEVCSAVVEWAGRRPDIEGVAVVGSWARSEANMRSDIDLVILTTEKATYVGSEDWASTAVAQAAELIRTQEWGPLTEHRIRVASGLEIEFGFVSLLWAETNPVDPGTAGVVLDGCIPILDRAELFMKLIQASG
jgi:predicted nucleotidyltransferase